MNIILWEHVHSILTNRKILLRSPGLIQLRKGFWGLGLITGGWGAYIWGSNDPDKKCVLTSWARRCFSLYFSWYGCYSKISIQLTTLSASVCVLFVNRAAISDGSMTGFWKVHVDWNKHKCALKFADFARVNLSACFYLLYLFETTKE